MSSVKTMATGWPCWNIVCLEVLVAGWSWSAQRDSVQLDSSGEALVTATWSG
jgi:hypothetical protein